MQQDYLVKAIVNYFATSPFEGKDTQMEQVIQIGTLQDVADVVLQDTEGNYIAIVDCVYAWEVTEETMLRLRCFLSATDTQFGVLAVGTDPEHWSFLENQRNNWFVEIPRGVFECRVSKWGRNVRDTTTLLDLKNTISTLQKRVYQVKRQVRTWQNATIVSGITLIILLLKVLHCQ